MKKYDEFKIRSMLGEDYYLHEKIEEVDGQFKTKSWALYEIHNNWLNDGSKPIMTSEKNTWEELCKFAKENRKYNLVDVLRSITIIAFIVCILTLIVVIFNLGNYLKGFMIGLIVMEVIIDSIVYEFSNHNFDVNMKKYRKKHEEILKELYKNENDD